VIADPILRLSDRFDSQEAIAVVFGKICKRTQLRLGFRQVVTVVIDKLMRQGCRHRVWRQ
jgi:hypothetical protein